MLPAASAPRRSRQNELQGIAHARRRARLEAIYGYLAENDSRANAGYVLDKLVEVAESLAAYPERGSYPKELLALGIREYRQAHFKPHRLIYRIHGKQVIIYLIADGRRDMQTLLTRRMLGLCNLYGTREKCCDADPVNRKENTGRRKG